MKVFISWSGATSRSVAEVFHFWIPRVIQTVEPFLSSKDLDKGANWTLELARELEDTNFAIICLAPDNLESPWLHYEAGAIAKRLDSRPCPVLFNVRKEQVRSPLSQFQLTSIVREDINVLMKSINKSAGNPLSDGALIESIDVWWSTLEEKISEIVSPADSAVNLTTPEPEKPPFDIQDMLGEIITRLRRVENRTRNLGDVIKSTASINIPVIPSSSNLNKLIDAVNQQAAREGLFIAKWEADPWDITFYLEGNLPNEVSFPLWMSASQLSKEEKVNVVLLGSDGKLIFQGDSYQKS